MTLTTWAAKWGIPVEAFLDLQQLTGMAEPPVIPRDVPPLSEAAVQQQVRLEASKRGLRLWRNNNGAAFDKDGRMIRYGLGNDSASLNKQIKSHDLIGVTPYMVSTADIGKTLGIFTSYEVKRGDWKYTGTEREVAQRAWMELVLSLGGISKFIKDAGEL